MIESSTIGCYQSRDYNDTQNSDEGQEVICPYLDIEDNDYIKRLNEPADHQNYEIYVGCDPDGQRRMFLIPICSCFTDIFIYSFIFFSSLHPTIFGS